MYKAEFPKNMSPKVEAKQLSDRYGVDGYPTVVVTSVRGQELGRIRGNDDVKSYIKRLENIIDQR